MTFYISYKYWPILIFIALLLVGFAMGVFEYLYENRFYPGVTINNTSVGGRTYQEVLDEFIGKSEAIKKDGLEVIFVSEGGEEKIRIASTANGLSPDNIVEYYSIENAEPLVKEAYQWGREGSLLQRTFEQSSLFLGKNINVSVVAHKEAIQSLLFSRAKYFFEPAVSAQFIFD